MDIETKFSEGDSAYLLSEAQVGNTARVRVVSVRGDNDGGVESIHYQLYGVKSLYNTWYAEANLKTYDEAKEIAEAYLTQQIAKDEAALDDLSSSSSSSSASP